MNQIERLKAANKARTKGFWELTLDKPNDFPCVFLDPEKEADITIADMNFIDECANSMSKLLAVVDAAKELFRKANPYLPVDKVYHPLRDALAALEAL